MDKNRPNILIIVSDQLAASALTAYGADFARTPTIDHLAQNGVSFSQAYTTCPLCAPARASFWSGLLPHQTGIRSNGGQCPNPPFASDLPTLGSLLAESGYDCHHFGKEHDHGTLRGFTCHPGGHTEFPAPRGYAYNHDSWQDEHTTQQLESFFEDYAATGPCCIIADMQNPHNICGFVAENDEGCLLDEQRPLPPLPANFAHAIDDRPKPVQYLCCSHRRQFQAVGWTDRQWQQYRAAYRQFIEQCDAHIARILTAMRQRPEFENTMIVFFADHGDGMGAHKLATKHTTFYDETTRVPFIISGPNVVTQGTANDRLLSLLDVVPTVCGFAGVTIPPELPGIDLSPLAKGKQPIKQHEFVVSQWHTEWGHTVEPGRMICDGRYKYTCYREENGEEFFDLRQDPGEVTNLIDDAAHAEVIGVFRRRFQEYCRDTHDDFAELSWVAAERWRSHAVGYDNHDISGCAPFPE